MSPLSQSDEYALPFDDLSDIISETEEEVSKEVKEGTGKRFMAPPASDSGPSDPPASSGPQLLDKPPKIKPGQKMRDLLKCFEGTDTPKPILYNVLTVLLNDREWHNVLSYDEFSQTVITRRETPWEKPKGEKWSDQDDTQLAAWLQFQNLNVSSKLCAEAIEVASRKHSIHPVRAYLRGLEWDGHDRAGGWLVDRLRAEDKPIVREFGKRWLISAVARVMEPGCQADHTLLLVGAQGIKKSSALRTLAGDGWFTDHISDLHDRDSRLELQGKWIIELSELHGVKGKGMEAVKSFLTTRIDSFRAPWGRRTQSLKRQCVFAATTNDFTALTDETGNRRFWPVTCGIEDFQIDLGGLEADRDQLWAEAFALYKRKVAWWLDSAELVGLAEKEQMSHYQPGPWDEAILRWAENPITASPALADLCGIPEAPLLSEPGCILINELLQHALGLKPEEMRGKGRPDLSACRCLRANGWAAHQHGAGLDGKKFWGKKNKKCPRIVTI